MSTTIQWTSDELSIMFSCNESVATRSTPEGIMKIIECVQRSPEWVIARLGRLTSSCAADALATLKGKGEAAARRHLRTRLVLERLTNTAQENGYVSDDMQRGIDCEAAAIAAYESETGHLVDAVGFVAHDELAAGCSPDGMIDHFTGLIEVKCRRSANHLAFLKSKEIPSDAKLQIVHQIWITGAEWCDYVSWDDRFPPSQQLAILRVARDPAEMSSYELMARGFLREVDEEVASLHAGIPVP